MSCGQLVPAFIALNRLKRSRDLCKAVVLVGFNKVCGTRDFDNELDRRALCELFCCCMTGGLGQRCVAGVVMQADGFEGYRGYYKQEVPYLNRAPVMSRNEPVRPTRSRPAGSRIPDVVVVKNARLPPVLDNVQRVYEMKFPGDGFSSEFGPDGMNQFQAYQEIFGEKFLKKALDAGSCACDSDGRNVNESVLNQATLWQANREKAISLAERVNADTASAVGAAAGASALGRALRGVGAVGSALARVLGLSF
ncbi:MULTISPECIES: hypothetical protein [Delftia]|uniref:hypothetical protein n=1 Tax=Delftia TaxID=80865 RepID=UPI0007739BB7|nr:MULTISPECIES: hypothetical protein [Delftia]MBS3719742.1 hypothetical protein [Delftia sp. PE138]MPT50321.1 hypothetical protein [Delftia sp.]SFA81599.1 hypothetical protein SAMN05444579_101150 [Delftia tsuruhatensis]